MEKDWLWDRNVASAYVKGIFGNESHPRFVEFAALLLSRKNTPKEVFKEYFSAIVFCRNWHIIKKRMRQDSWNNPRIEFWQAVYERLLENYKKKNIKFRQAKTGDGPMNELAKDIAQRIIKMRKQKGLTQQDVAKKTGFSQQMISRIEKAKQNISITTLKRVAESMGCEVRVELVSK